MPEPERNSLLKSLKPDEADALLYRWSFWGRPEQFAPDGDDWFTWLILAGRGWGKTRTGAEWVRSQVCGPTPLGRGKSSRVAIVAETAADARDVMVEGASGILDVHPKDFRPIYEPSKRRLTWPNGAVATLYNAVEPDQLRGPQHDLAWSDELAKWQYARETWNMLQFGLRIGDKPKQCVTTTPRPIPVLKEIMADKRTVTTRGSTLENRSNLAAGFLQQIIDKYEGTRLGRQELNAEVLDDVIGGLWTRANIDAYRKREADLPDMRRVVVAIDPALKATGDPAEEEEGAETGIIAAGLGVDGRGYVLGDWSCRLGPDGWARRAVAAYDKHDAMMIVAEKNQGGGMVETTLRSVRHTIPVSLVWASQGKTTRAEPVAALYEQGRVSHVGSHPILEDQMMMFTQFGIEKGTTGDRVDALVWALSELFPQIIMHRDPKPEPKKRPPMSGYRESNEDDDSLSIKVA